MEQDEILLEGKGILHSSYFTYLFIGQMRPNLDVVEMSETSESDDGSSASSERGSESPVMNVRLRRRRRKQPSLAARLGVSRKRLADMPTSHPRKRATSDKNLLNETSNSEEEGHGGARQGSGRKRGRPNKETSAVDPILKEFIQVSL